MASVFGHGIVGFTIAKLADSKRVKWLLFFAILSTILPDIDVLAFKFGISYSHPFGHRGFTHSIIFALLWASLLMLTIGKLNKLLWLSVIFLSTISHGIFDAMTNGGKGVGFLIPFNNDRFFFPFREIQVSPLRINSFFSEWGLHVILSELKFIFLPCLLVFVLSLIIKRY